MSHRFFLLLFLLPFGSHSQSIENIFDQKFDNGLNCIVIENSTIPLVTIEWVVKDGVAYESKEVKGYSSLIQKLFFAGNKDYPTQNLMRQRLNQLGAVIGSTQSEEHASVYLTCSKRNFDNALKLFISSLKHPLFQIEEVDSALNSVLVDQSQIQSDAYFLFDQQLDKILFPNAKERKDQVVTSKITSSTTPEKLINYQKLFYSPNNSCIIISGDVNHTAIFQKIRDASNSLTKNNQLPTDIYNASDFSSITYSSQFVVETPLVQSPLLIISLPVPDIRQNPYTAFTGELLEALVNSTSSSLNKNLVAGGYAYQVSARYRKLKFGSSFDFIIAPKPEKFGECYDKARIEINALANFNNYTTEQIKQAAQLLYSNYAFTTERTTQLSHFVAASWAKTNSAPSLDINKTIDALKYMNEVINYCQLYFQNKPFVAGLLISPSQKINFNSTAILTSTFKMSDYKISFTKSDDQIFDPQNKEIINSLAQLLKINPSLKIELISNQDEVEKKETAKARFISVYKNLEAAGAPESIMDAMTVSLYIRHSENNDQLKNNMTVQFKLLIP